MAVTPTGPISLPLANLRALLANCDAWRDWVGGTSGRASVTEAKAKIFLFEPTSPTTGQVYTDDELIALRPFAVIGLYYPQRSQMIGFDPVRVALGTYRFVSHLVLSIEDNVDEDDAGNTQDLMLKFANFAGLTLAEVLERSPNVDYLNADELNANMGGVLIKSLSPLQQIQRAEAEVAKTQGDHVSGEWLVEIGL